MARYDAVCLGILVADVVARPVDVVPEPGTLSLVDELTVRGGGGALNTSTALSRWGLRTAAAGKVGSDPLGDFVLSVLDSRGVDRAGVLQDPRVPTSATVVLVDSGGERTFLHLPGANGSVTAGELDTEVVFGGRCLLVTGALVMPALDGEPTAAILAEAKTRGVLTALDTVYDSTGRWERVLPALPHVDLFMPGLAEGQAISGEEEPSAVADRLRARGVRTVALKMGERGCYVAGDGFEAQVDPVRVRPVDGTGAGDAFIAGMLYGALAAWPLARSVRLANAAGALATTALGAAEGIRTLEETMAAAGLAVRSPP